MAAPSDLSEFPCDIDLTDLDRFAAGFPHDLFTRLRAEAPVAFHPPTEHTPGGEGFWVLTRHADVTAAARDGATFSSDTGGAREGGGTLIEDLPPSAAGVLMNMMDDPRHQQIRKLVSPQVSPKSLAAMEDDLRRRSEAMVDAVVEKGECDFLVEVAAELPLQAIARLLGVPMEDRHQLFAWANAALDYDDRDLGQSNERTLAAAGAQYVYGGRLIEEKQKCPADDLLSAVVHAPFGTTREEQQMFFSLLIAAGSETTRNSIGAGLMALIQHPDQWRRLQADRSLMTTAVEEMLRWGSSTPYNRRTATRDVEVGGKTIGAGDKVTLWWASANRDEAVFADPFRFDITRTPNPHVTFGHGVHFCLGAALARMEIRLVFNALLDRVDHAEMTGPPEWTRSNKHTGLRHVPVRLHPR
ncbi:MAG TPA: cytochrome P450 [Acidimicrobiales bacterium]|nr:cytochrome P450 [Acidimicrobiales bacterium]